MGTTPVEWLEKELNAIRLDVDKNVLKFIDKSFEIAKELEKEQQGYSEEKVIAFGEFIFKHSLLTHTRGVKSLFEEFKTNRK